ncbi:unnamed protein product [Caenorhabditis angaria]|uniref:Seven TM Receptor n=1 Tax=Caenorhabditis angaria TaxID=860376 RepID=A0A9P1IRX1_9PELO|nr:unnamed protein product [Caenorhabditis angaria]
MDLQTLHSYGSSYAAFININLTWIKNKELTRILIDAWCGMYGTFMGMFALHYIYRYFVIMSNTKMLKTFKSYKIIYWMLLPLIYGTVWGTICYYFCASNPEFTDYLSKSFHDTYNLEMTPIVYIGVHFFPTNENGEKYINWNGVIGVGIIWTMIMSSFFIIIYFGVSCYLQIRKNFETSSRQNNNLQMQVFISLVVQTLVPITLMHLPVSMVFLFTFLEISIGKFTGLVVISIAVFPAIDPLPTMLIISDYRETILKTLQSFLNKKQTSKKREVEMEIQNIN